MVKIVGLGGSLRSQSYSASALKLAAMRVEALGAEVEILNLRDLKLPFCDGSDEYPDYPDVERMKNIVKEYNEIPSSVPIPDDARPPSFTAPSNWTIQPMPEQTGG